MKSIPKVIYLLLATGVLINALRTYYVQTDMAYIMLEEVYPWYFTMGYFGSALVTMAAVLSFMFYRKYFPTYVTVSYLLIILLVIIASLNDKQMIMLRPNVFYSVKGIGTHVNFGLLFFAANTIYYPKILKLFYYICFAFIIAGIINLGKMGLGASREQYLDAIRHYAVYLIWVFPFFLLQEEESKLKNLINIATYLVISIFIITSGARSYLAIYVMYLMVKFKEQLKSKNALLTIIGVVVLGGIGYLILTSSGALSSSVGGAVTNLSERAGDDTRSSQLNEFLSQYDLDYLFQGVGPSGTWNWSSWPVPYFYLDNQILLLAWWAGLPTLLAYLYFVIKPLTKKAEITLFEDVRGVRMIIIIWLLACAGFAIYVGISSDLYYYFITLLIGLQTCKYTLLLSPDEQET